MLSYKVDKLVCFAIVTTSIQSEGKPRGLTSFEKAIIISQHIIDSCGIPSSSHEESVVRDVRRSSEC